MTSPVFSEQTKMIALVLSDSRSIAFVIHHDYSLETTFELLDEHVKIMSISERFVAALRFSGRWSESNFNNKSKELLADLAKVAVKTKGNVFVMRYSGPFRPWFLRRNEVAIEIELDKNFET
jgi:hypothetical protein